MNNLTSEDLGKQTIRFKRFLMALTTYTLNIIAAYLILQLGLGEIEPTVWWLFVGSTIVINLVFALMFLNHWNLRFRDPSLTALQILVSASWGMILVYGLPEARPLILLFFIPAFSFGMLRLNTQQYVLVAGLCLAEYAGLLFWENFYRPTFRLEFELFLFVLFSAVLLWMAVFGGMVSKIRRELKRKTVQLQHANELITRQSSTDDLTLVYNRRHAIRVLKHFLAIANRFEMPFSVALIDIDHFKQINDEHGHLVGDEVLKEFARRLADSLRETDVLLATTFHPEIQDEDSDVELESFVARYGGEEFLILLPGVDQPHSLSALQRLREAIGIQAFYVPFPLVVRFSAGVAQYQRGETLENLLHRADEALYRAKNLGRDRVEFAE
ncbi:GGDEF domain-containing protein [Permianibacter aggregans]|uniref:diguanylate cyclase n=1 Tax=Permianibacter aggregans TaxID=1510150 RepID=A0A4R6UE16_9GAMM|nr:GGDEF domain-containing protein [Permianibacter aggregans]QGX38229.1 GGDEF domain-containing protein [Permianibacter aggregans]TDQ44146.1 diguanylate cyclase (GGDEF)-like protein [Permianibacter aggregans]